MAVSSALDPALHPLETEVANVPAHVFAYRSAFYSRANDPDASLTLEGVGGEIERSPPARDPASLANDVDAQTSYLRKLKFIYLEQNAKRKYIESVMSDIDHAPLVTKEDNALLAEDNVAKKERLREVKEKLRAQAKDVRDLAPLVEEDYQRVKTATKTLSTLTSQILEVKLALTRLRTAHPLPRLSISSAEAKLEAQVAKMQSLESTLQARKRDLAQAKERLKIGNELIGKQMKEKVELEKLVNERMDKEGRGLEEERRLNGVHEMYSVSLALQKNLTSIIRMTSPSENEHRLTFLVPTPFYPRRTVTIVFIFIPNTNVLGAGNVLVNNQGSAAGVEDGEEEELEVGDIFDECIQVNDVRMLISAVLAFVRRMNDG